jgi:catechol 2,3-dioxygenase-like lactoylglutathione lyase family enzyme
MRQLRIQGLDHVALAVSDQARFERWYRDVLELERVYEREWGNVPIMLVRGGSGVAPFQAQPGPDSEPAVRILHIAFRVDRQDFEAAQRTLDDRGIPYHCEDHGVSHSVYFRDPDGHELELTTYELRSG